jgi:hypothetical protein
VRRYAELLIRQRGFSKPYLTLYVPSASRAATDADADFVFLCQRSYLTHSTFSIIFPLHLAVLKVLRPRNSSRTYVKSLLRLVSTQVCRTGDKGG